MHIPAIIVATFGLVGRQKRQKCIYLIKFRWLWQQVGVLLVALGCCGGFKESRVLLIVYIVLIVAVLLLVNISIFLNWFPTKIEFKKTSLYTRRCLFARRCCLPPRAKSSRTNSSRKWTSMTRWGSRKRNKLCRIFAILFKKRQWGKPNVFFFFLKDATEGDAKKATTSWDKGQKVVRINRHFLKN